MPCPGESAGWQRSRGRIFCRPGTSFIEHYACCAAPRGAQRMRVTSLIGAANLSSVTNLDEDTGAVSRYKVDRSQKTVKAYWIYIEGMCGCPGATTIMKLFWVQEQSKTVTSLLNMPSVLAFRCLFFVFRNENNPCFSRFFAW